MKNKKKTFFQFFGLLSKIFLRFQIFQKKIYENKKVSKLGKSFKYPN